MTKHRKLKINMLTAPGKIHSIVDANVMCVKRFACSLDDGANIHINSSLYSIRSLLLIDTSKISLTAVMASSLLDATTTPFPPAKPLALTTNAGKSALQQN